ncbi:MAG: hypothetical protein U0556_06020 [Dehalococcoidia bacterium]
MLRFLLVVVFLLPSLASAAPNSAFTSASGATPGSNGAALTPRYKGITADSLRSAISIIDPATDTVTGPFLANVGQELLDVAITPDENTALVSAFLSQKLLFVDISDIDHPKLKDSIDFRAVPTTTPSFHPEDIAITPDGRFAVVSDGAMASCGYSIAQGIATINLTTRTLKQYLTLSKPKVVQSVSVDKYGNVYGGDYCNQKLYVLTLGSDGTVADTASEFALDIRPLNSYVSPDSRQLFVTGFKGVEVYQIEGPGKITASAKNLTLGNIQSMAFSADGTKGYLADIASTPDRIIVLDTRTLQPLRTISLLSNCAGGYYGTDVTAITPDGKKLYVGNLAAAGSCDTSTKLFVMDLDDYHTGAIDLGPDSAPAATAFRGLFRFDFYVPLAPKGF